MTQQSSVEVTLDLGYSNNELQSIYIESDNGESVNGEINRPNHKT